MKKQITYIISNINKAIAFEWICEQLNKNDFELSFVLLNDGSSYLEEYLIKSKTKVLRIKYKSKKDIPLAIFKLIYFLKKNKTEIVHTHLFDATFVGLIAAKFCGIKKRIYTRHYSTYHHDFFPNAVKWDKLNNNLATHIVAISQVVKDILILKEDVRPEKISMVYHGFKLNEFSENNIKVTEELNIKYNPLNKRPVIGVISRFTELKGVQYIIPAFKEVLKDKPDALLLLFNAFGDYDNYINRQLEELPATSYKKVIFENEITSLYHLFDIFIHVPINSTIEAFGQTYIECMASGTPLIATKSGIANEILINKENAIIVDYQNSKEIYNAVELLLNKPLLSTLITNNARVIINEKFQLKTMVEKIEKLYLS